MLRPEWYLVDGDFYADQASWPHHNGAEEEDAATCRGLAYQLLVSDEASQIPARTMSALQLALMCASRLLDAAIDGKHTHEVADLARMVRGLNLLHAYLAQTAQKLAEQVASCTFGLAGVADMNSLAAITGGLSQAGFAGELLAGHLKDADFALWQLVPHSEDDSGR